MRKRPRDKKSEQPDEISQYAKRYQADSLPPLHPLRPSALPTELAIPDFELGATLHSNPESPKSRSASIANSPQAAEMPDNGVIEYLTFGGLASNLENTQLSAAPALPLPPPPDMSDSDNTEPSVQSEATINRAASLEVSGAAAKPLSPQLHKTANQN